MTARSRLTALSVAAALLGGTLAAAPATAQQRVLANPFASPETTDFDIAALDVDLTAHSLEVGVRLENPLPTVGLDVLLSTQRDAFDGDQVVLSADADGGGVSTSGWTQRGRTGPVVDLPEGAVRVVRTPAGAVLSVDRAVAGVSGPLYVLAAAVGSGPDGAHGFSMAAASDTVSEDRQFGLGPVSTEPDRTTTSATLTARTQTYGQARAVQVAAKVPADVPGVVTFTDGRTRLGSVVPRRGTATLALPRTLRAGTHVIRATFVPVDGLRFAPSHASVALRALPRATTTTIRLSRSRQVAGSARRARVTVTVSGRARGTVTVHDGRRRLSRLAVRDGRAAFTVSRRLAVGSHRLQAVFRPADAGTTAGSTSRTVTLRVTRR